MEKSSAKVSAKGWIVIPASLRRKYGIKPGSIIKIGEENNKIVCEAWRTDHIQNDFNVEIRGDLVVGRIKKLSPQLMERKMLLLGQLVAFTRQLDVQMSSDQQILKFLSKFEQLTRENETITVLGRETS